MEVAEGTPKRSRSRGGESGSGSSGGGDHDRLSALPDCLLHIIMSSLKARQVVQTCVLSTRWRHLWRSVPCLDIDIAEFRGVDYRSSSSDSGFDSDSSGPDPDSDYDDKGKGKGWEGFEDFAANLMLHCNIAQLDSFRLNIDRGRKPQFDHWSSNPSYDSWTYSGRQAAAWLCRAMKYCTPEHAVSSSWRLKRLHLCHVPLDGRFAEHLSSVCRSLEDLELEDCICEIHSIASDSLKNLVLKRCVFSVFLYDIACPTLKTLVIDGGSNRYVGLLAISTPMVACLRLHVDVCRFRGGISVNKMPSLDRASIHLQGHKKSIGKGPSGGKLYDDQSKLLCSLSNVTSLELLGIGKTLLGEEPAFQEFHNLRNLLLDDCDLSDEFRILRFFHRGSPNLEKVTLRHCEFPGDSEDNEGDCEDKETDSEDNEGDSEDKETDSEDKETDFEDKEGERKLDRTSSSGGCFGLDFLYNENVELEIIHKDSHVCRCAADDIGNPKGTTGVVHDTVVAEELVSHSTGVGPRQGTRHRTTSVRISGPEWQWLM